MASDANMLKASSLLLLSLQNFAYGLLLPVARKADENGNVFFGPTAVVTTELIKILISLCGLAREGQARAVQRRTGSVDWTDEKIHQAAERATADRDSANNSLARQAGVRVAAIRDLVFQGSSFKLLLPAVLFVIQNNLQIQSASYLDATEFQVLSQLKLVTAALCSVLILKRKLNMKHWSSILLLILGICIVQQASGEFSSSSSSSSTLSHSITHQHPQAFLIGSMAMLGACSFSGVASITMEYLLKNEIGFWSSNLLLATYSIIPASIPLFADVVSRGHFDIYRHFTAPVWATIVLNAIGGMLVSMVMKYADNILKGFAVAASLIATVLVQSDHASFSWTRMTGAVVVVGSMIGYSQASVSPALPQEASLPRGKLDVLFEDEEEP